MGMESKALQLLEENDMKLGEKETLLQHLTCAKKMALDKVTRIWRDSGKVLCVEYGDACWFHYDGQGSGIDDGK